MGREQLEKITTEMTGLWQPSVHMDVAFLFLAVIAKNKEDTVKCNTRNE